MTRQLLAAGAAALALALAGSAQATVYTLTQDACTGTCGSPPFGTVTTSQTAAQALAGTVDVTVQLASDTFFNDHGKAPVHFALAFDLPQADVAIGDLTSPFTADGAQASNAAMVSGFGDFDYFIHLAPKAGSSFQTLSFDVTAPGLTPADFGFTASPFGKTYFAADVIGNNGKTGEVGAGPGETGGVPEPATWAMMLTGVFGLGGLLRRRRQGALAAA